MAAVDPSMLPKLYCAILKDDVRAACQRAEEVEWLAAEHRVKCHAEACEQGRKTAVLWKKKQLRRHRRLEDIARAEEERLEREREEEAAAQAKVEADIRWKKAFERINHKEAKRVPLFGMSHAEAGLEALQALAHPTSPKHEHEGSDDEEHSEHLEHSEHREHSEEHVDVVQNSNTYSNTSLDHEIERDTSKESSKTIQSMLSWKLKKEPLDNRILHLRRIQKLRNRSTRFAQQYEVRKTRFYRLPEEERNLCEAAYLQFGADPYNRTLDVPSVRDCLYEVGARGVTLEEQLAVLKVCSEAHSTAAKTARAVNAEGVNGPLGAAGQEVRMACMRGGIDLYTFAATILPQSRKSLDLIRRRQVEILFKKRDLHGTGQISIKRCAEILRNLVRNENITAKKLEALIQSGEVIHIDLPVIETMESDSPKEKKATYKSEECEKEQKQASEYGSCHSGGQYVNKLLNLDHAQRLALHYYLKVEAGACAQERQIQQEFDIYRDIFKMTRVDLVVLHRTYKKIVGQKQRPLTVAECDRVFQECGMVGINTEQHVGVRGIDFVDLLNLVEQVRVDVESDAFDDLRNAFEDYPEVHPNTKMLAVTDVQDFLASEGLVPSADEEQEQAAITRALEDVLAMSMHEDDMLEFEQVKRVMQRMREMGRRQHHDDEVRAALAHGFLEDELGELRDTFNVLDADGSGTIEPDEAWSAVKSLGFQISKAMFSTAYRQVDNGGHGHLDFVGCLKLLQLIRDRQGCFSTNRHIDVLNDLLRAELLHLLKIFQEPINEEAEALVHGTLLTKVCIFFGLDAHDPLNKRIHVKTFQDLCTAAAAICDKQVTAG